MTGMWWIIGGVLLVWVVCAGPIAIIVGRTITRRDRAEFDRRTKVWADGVVQSIGAESDIEPESSQPDRRNPPLIS